MDLFKLVGSIFINSDEANQQIDETGENAEGLASRVSSAFQSAGDKLATIGTALQPVSDAVINVGQHLYGLATKTASTTDNIDKMSQKMGISRTAFQEWDYILSQNGASIDSLKVGMKTLTTTLDAVQQSGSTADTAFERLGVSYDKLKNMNPEQAFEATIKALQSCSNETERTKLATELFGRAGMELAPLLNSGAGSVEALKQKAHELGLVLDDETIDAGVAMTDAMDTMQRSLSTIGSAIATEVMPYITKFGDYVSSHVPQIREFVKSLCERFEALSPPIKKLIGVVSLVAAAASPVLMIGSKIFYGISSLISSFGTVSTALTALSGPIGVVIGVVAALVAGIVYLYKTNDQFRNKVNLIWEQVKQKIGVVIEGIQQIIQSFVEAAISFWNEWGDEILNVVNTAFDFVATYIQGVLDVIIAIVETFVALFQGDWEGVWSGIQNIVSTAWQFLTSIVSAGLTFLQTLISTGLSIVSSVFSNIWNRFITIVSNVWTNIKTSVSSGIDNVKSTVSSKLGAIKDKFSEIWDNCKLTVKNAIDKIKGFTKFSWSLPNLKLPHITITGSFSLNPPSAPHFAISWNRKAMGTPYLFQDPTLFNINPLTGTASGAGEAGDEIMYGRDNLMRDIEEASGKSNNVVLYTIQSTLEAIFELLGQYIPSLSNMQMVTDTGVLVGELTPMIDTKLGEIYKRKKRGG